MTESSVFEEIAKLVEYIPIEGTLPSNGRLIEGATIDSHFRIKSGDPGKENAISLRDVVRIFNKFLRDVNWQKLIIKQRYEQLREIGCTYPAQYLLFDFCLAALEGDYLDAKLYLAHAFHILGLHKALNLLLSVIINEALTQDQDVRYLLLLLARSTEPRNAQSYRETFGPEFDRRYNNYLQEVDRLEPNYGDKD